MLPVSMPHELPKAYEPGAIETRWAVAILKMEILGCSEFVTTCTLVKILNVGALPMLSEEIRLDPKKQHASQEVPLP